MRSEGKQPPRGYKTKSGDSDEMIAPELPAELILYLGEFLTVDTKLTVCKALWDDYPDVRKWIERKRVARAVRKHVKNDDVNVIENLAAMTDHHNLRFLKPQLIRLAIAEKSFRVLKVLCLRFDAHLNENVQVSFSCPGAGIALTAIPLQQPTDSKRVDWEMLIISLISFERLLSWPLLTQMYFIKKVVGPLPANETLHRLGFQPQQVAAYMKWEDKERKAAEKKQRRARHLTGASAGGLLQLVAYGLQDVYLLGSPQITFF